MLGSFLTERVGFAWAGTTWAIIVSLIVVANEYTGRDLSRKQTA
jgi:hypothetical protein